MLKLFYVVLNINVVTVINEKTRFQLSNYKKTAINISRNIKNQLILQNFCVVPSPDILNYDNKKPIFMYF